ncbi:hypothetical protein SAMN05216571_101400 [Onishia taeanensis]|uniref:Uncharacterized protein n=1 Tax=Onishia taeanensis TaxID=284577 RepID=A0A1G7NEZ6_9GAMM|nr:hypothetical protein [Halomonas taeanensis]SDF72542.1 hypothetical protein SAMN05216571_101400 [Halomonas taeanensis]
MKKIALIATMFGTIVATNVNADYLDNVAQAGDECLTLTLEKTEPYLDPQDESYQQDGKVVTTSIPLSVTRSVVAGDSKTSHSRVKNIPYITSTYLDEGNPGSFWFDCMEAKGATGPEATINFGT